MATLYVVSGAITQRHPSFDWQT